MKERVLPEGKYSTNEAEYIDFGPDSRVYRVEDDQVGDLAVKIYYSHLSFVQLLEYVSMTNTLAENMGALQFRANKKWKGVPERSRILISINPVIEWFSHEVEGMEKRIFTSSRFVGGDHLAYLRDKYTLFSRLSSYVEKDLQEDLFHASAGKVGLVAKNVKVENSEEVIGFLREDENPPKIDVVITDLRAYVGRNKVWER